MADADEPLGPTEVADALGQPVNTIKQRMYQMNKDGDLKVASRGRYTVSHNLHNQRAEERSHNLHNQHNLGGYDAAKVTESGDNHNRQTPHRNAEVTKVMEVTAPPDDKRHSSSLAGSAPGKATEDMALVERDSAENAEPPDYDAMVEARRAKLEAKFEDMPF